MTWQEDLEGALCRVAQDYDEIAKDLAAGATEIRHAAARARRLRSEATTRWLKEQLEATIAQHEQIASEIERASEPGADAAAPQAETAAVSSETPGR
jgi:hypothetical protein